MTFERRRAVSAAPILAIAMAVSGVPAVAQEAVRTIPNLGNFSLTPSGPQASPTPTATPVPLASPLSLPAITPLPQPRATPAPRSTPAPRATPTPSATPTPRAAPTPAPAETPTSPPQPMPTPAPAAVEQPVAVPSPTLQPTAAPARPEAPLWPWLAGAGALAVALGVAWRWSRRREQNEGGGAGPVVEPIVPPAAPAAQRARLALAFRPTRAGLNMLSATVDGEVTVVNRGDASAADIRLKAQLASASAGQDAALSAFAAEAIGRPAVPPFALEPGEERRVRIVVALPREAIEPISASGRAMFIPLVALNMVYAAGEGVAGQTVQAFAVGVERVDSSKLAPFWLDGPPRMQDAVAARPHAVSLER